jgi:glycine dehydrogenase subunit 1
MSESLVHRYVPNTAPGVREAMLKEIGVDSVDQIYEEIPQALRFKGELNIPKEPASELEVARRIKSTLAKNHPVEGLLCFTGAGCWPHYVPALCDEIAGRSEFLTAYAGSDATDHGRYQAMFEFQSMMGDLLEMDVVSAPVYDGSTAAGDAAQMASRATGRKELLVPSTSSPERLAAMKNYCDPWLQIESVDADSHSGQMDLSDLKAKISSRTAAVFVENPGYLGFIETECEAIAEIAHQAGALLVAFVNPMSLGVLKAPGEYGADIACGEGQPLGMHLQCGGATLGILACNDAERFLPLMPSFLAGLSSTSVPGEHAFSWHTLWDRMVYATRDKAKSFTGTSSWLWGISAAVYMALMGPKGMRQLGEANMQKAYYAMDVLSTVKGLKVPTFASPHFNEFVVNFDETGSSVAEINQHLLERDILGGHDLSGEFLNLGNSALYCVTEIHARQDIDRLAQALQAIAA